MALPGTDPTKPDSDELQLRVDFFRKLGYSTKDVGAALRKLDLETDTNAVLGELVRIGARASPISNSDNEERSHKSSLLPISWTSGPARNMPETVPKKNTDEELRPIVIDGSNVAMSHGNKAFFSCRGIQLAVNFFLDRGHKNIKVFVPSWRKEQPRPDAPIRDQHILTDLENQNIVVFTPSRHIGGKRVVCYDDRFIVRCAFDLEGVIVSNDTYRDLQGENEDWKKCIEKRLLMYSFVNDRFMPPDDPLGRHGPTLDNFLRRKPLPTDQRRQLCPYGKKCTYGIKCKYYHPERTNQPYMSVADELREKAQISSSYENDPNVKSSSPKQSINSFQASENILLFREAPGSSQNHIQVSGDPNEWAGSHHHHVMPGHYFGNMSQEYLDSGLGSYDSHYEAQHCLSNSPRLWPQQNQSSPGSRHGSVQSCSYALPLSTPQNQPNHYAYPHKTSLPNYLQYSGGPHAQPNHWSEPYQGVPQARTSLPLATHSLHPGNQYNSPQYNHWAQQQQQQSSYAASDPNRLELRKRLQAIFNPQDIDRVMEMFPNLMDVEKLAAEIFKQKAKRGGF